MSWEIRGQFWFAIFIFLTWTTGVLGITSIITGRRAPCSNEGEPVRVDHIDKLRCFSCICMNGLVECRNENYCPPIEGCHMLVEKTEDGCCQKCKGCMYNGVHHESHTEWTELGDPCKVMRCEAGVVTVSNVQCHTPCANPQPPEQGKCCPTCSDCKINGQTATDDRDVTSDDPCLKCRCNDGRLTCSKKACPVLQCSADRQHQPPGECCPKCTGTRSLYTYPKTCTLGSRFHRDGERFDMERCTKCTCINETSVCQRDSCPILNCAHEFQQKRSGNCCKECVFPEEFRMQCSYGGVVYEDGQSWKLDACSSCKCAQGMPSCAMTRCNVTLPCPPGSRLVHPPGECCGRCEESEGVCMAFGDPHYKTFDGKIYSFQGVGRYQFVADCEYHNFSIRVANVYQNKNSKTSTLTKRVAIKSGKMRINLGQNLRTKINGQKVDLPYKIEQKLLIEKFKDHLVIDLLNGVRILWTGKSFLELTVPASYKNKLCGLCGNFNNNVQDDLKLRKGPVVKESDILMFGASWCVGSKAVCAKYAKQTSKIRPCKAKRVDKNPCKYLTSTDLFNGCDSKLNYNKYYKACMMDMCECPSGRCYCESLMAYARECHHLGVDVLNWKKHSYCVANKSRRKAAHRTGLSKEKIDLLIKQRGINRTRSAQAPLPIQ